MKKKKWLLGIAIMLIVTLAATMVWVDRSEIVVRAETENGEEVVLAHVHSAEGGACYHHHSGNSDSSGGCYTVLVQCDGSISQKSGAAPCGPNNIMDIWEGDDGWWASCQQCGAFFGPHDFNDYPLRHTPITISYSCDRCGEKYNGSGICTKVTSYNIGCGKNDQTLECAYASCGTYYITNNNTTMGLENTTLTANVTSKEAGATVQSYQWSTGETSQTITVQSNGTYSCEITYTDSISGNVSIAGASYSVTNLDNVPPVVTLSYTPSTPTNTGTTIHITATDDTGVTGYSFDGVTFSQEQDHYVESNGSYMAYATDAAGNIGSAVITVDNIDQEFPEILSVTQSAEGRFINGSIKIHVTAQDMVSEGYAREISVQYSADGTHWSNSGEFSLTLDGTQEILVRDAAGNISKAPVTIYQDTTPPSISGTQTPQNWTNVVCLTVTATDDQSGIPEWAYKWNEGDWNPASQINVTSNGYYPVTVRDGAGNTASYTFHVTQIDRTAPSVDVHLATGDWRGGNNIIYIQASDQESGLPEAPYSYDGGVTWTDSAEYEISEDGEYFILVRDAVGNIMESRIYAEKTKPVTNENNSVQGGNTLEEDDEEFALTVTTQSQLSGKLVTVEPEEGQTTPGTQILLPARPTSEAEPVREQSRQKKVVLSISMPRPRADATSGLEEQNVSLEGSVNVSVSGLGMISKSRLLRQLAIAACGIGMIGLFLLFLWLSEKKANLYRKAYGENEKNQFIDGIAVKKIGRGKGYRVMINDRQITAPITERMTGETFMLKFGNFFAGKHESEPLVIELYNGRTISTRLKREVTF